MSHCDAGEPGRQFSATTAFAGDVHGSAAVALPVNAGSPNTATPNTTDTARRNCQLQAAMACPPPTADPAGRKLCMRPRSVKGSCLETAGERVRPMTRSLVILAEHVASVEAVTLRCCCRLRQSNRHRRLRARLMKGAYFTAHTSARTPSRQPIFLPSAYVLPAYEIPTS
jgi:hypothetical protein